MSHSYACATCRLRSVSRGRTQNLFQQRVWLSQISRAYQDLQETDSIGGKPERSSYRGRNSRAIWSSNHNGVVGRSQQDNNQPRGRYSGRLLGPQHLLQQLKETVDSKGQLGISADQSRRSPDNNAPTGVDERNGGYTARPHLPPDLFAKLQRFQNDAEEGHVREPWNALQEIVRERHDVEILQKAAQSRRFESACRRVLNGICKEWAQMMIAFRNGKKPFSAVEQLPSPLQALRYISIFRPSKHGIFIQALGRTEICTSGLRFSDLAGSPTSRQAFIMSLQELMGIWRLCMALKLGSHNSTLPFPTGARHDLILESRDWTFLPDSVAITDSMRLQSRLSNTPRSFAHTLSMLVPTARSITPDTSKKIVTYEDCGIDYATTALTTLDLLQTLKTETEGRKVVSDYKPWINLMESLLKSSHDRRIPPSLTLRIQAVGSDLVRQHYSDLVKRLHLGPLPNVETQRIVGPPRTEKAMDDVSSDAKNIKSFAPVEKLGQEIRSLSHEQAPVLNSNEDVTPQFVWRCTQRLGRALEHRNSRAAEGIWEEVQERLSRDLKVRPGIELLEHLLHTFWSLRSKNLAGEVWKSIMESGLQPTGKTYTIMMQGYASMKELPSMQSIWTDMRRAGIQPDAHAWAIRISGLLRSHRHVDAGMEALREMEQEWIRAARAAYAGRSPSKEKRANIAAAIRPSELVSLFEGDIDGVPRPSVVVMNAAVSSLARTNDLLVPKAITWGRSFGVDPDLTTYNALVNISMRNGLPEEALNILKRMEQLGLDANSDTWNVLLSAMFEGGMLDGLESKEQESRILEFVESSGTKIDRKGYALVIDRLLKVYNNPAAAQVVLSHMASRGIQPSPHIYTILMGSYFQQLPPNFAAAESLWSNIMSQDAGRGAPLDGHFYDRMIEGYATHYATVGTARMLFFLSVMESEGKLPSWRALELAARALAATGGWDRLAQIANRVRRRMRNAGRGENKWSGPGQRNFWEFIISTGMLKHEGITTSNQIMDVHAAHVRPR